MAAGQRGLLTFQSAAADIGETHTICGVLSEQTMTAEEGQQQIAASYPLHTLLGHTHSQTHKSPVTFSLPTLFEKYFAFIRNQTFRTGGEEKEKNETVPMWLMTSMQPLPSIHSFS